MDTVLNARAHVLLGLLNGPSWVRQMAREAEARTGGVLAPNRYSLQKVCPQLVEDGLIEAVPPDTIPADQRPQSGTAPTFYRLTVRGLVEAADTIGAVRALVTSVGSVGSIGSVG